MPYLSAVSGEAETLCGLFSFAIILPTINSMFLRKSLDKICEFKIHNFAETSSLKQQNSDWLVIKFVE